MRHKQERKKRKLNSVIKTKKKKKELGLKWPNMLTKHTVIWAGRINWPRGLQLDTGTDHRPKCNPTHPSKFQFPPTRRQVVRVSSISRGPVRSDPSPRPRYRWQISIGASQPASRPTPSAVRRPPRRSPPRDGGRPCCGDPRRAQGQV